MYFPTDGSAVAWSHTDSKRAIMTMSLLQEMVSDMVCFTSLSG